MFSACRFRTAAAITPLAAAWAFWAVSRVTSTPKVTVAISGTTVTAPLALTVMLFGGTVAGAPAAATCGTGLLAEPPGHRATTHRQARRRPQRAMIVRGCDAMYLFVLSGTWALILRAVSPLAVNRTWWPKAARLHTVRRRGGHKGNRPAIRETRCASNGHGPREIVDMLPQPGRNRWLMAAYRVLHRP